MGGHAASCFEVFLLYRERKAWMEWKPPLVAKYLGDLNPTGKNN
jgi:hypothetical protein